MIIIYRSNICKPLRVAFTTGGLQTAVDRSGPRNQFFSLFIFTAKEEFPGILTTLNDYDVTGVDQQGDLSAKVLKRHLFALGLFCSTAVLQGPFNEKFFFETVENLPMSNPFNKAAQKFSLASVSYFLLMIHNDKDLIIENTHYRK